MKSIYKNLISQLKKERKRLDYQINTIAKWNANAQDRLKPKVHMSSKARKALSQRMKAVWEAKKKSERR
jgi:hypothetical protein